MAESKLSLRNVLLLSLAAALCYGIFAYFLSIGGHSAGDGPFKAVAHLKGGESQSVTGTIHFYQENTHSPVQLTGEISGLDRASLRAFHIHEFGDLGDKCMACGAHYNPHSSSHGSSSDPASDRHVGDLGNVQSDVYGKARISLSDPLLALTGRHSIIGRSVVVHSGTDDLGKGNHPDSLKTGNAGARAACGVIGGPMDILTLPGVTLNSRLSFNL